jgi:DNA-binding NarL/FixJ family response regulator
MRDTKPYHRPLLVTTHQYPCGAWADIARSAGQGLQMWRQRRHAVVFADFADLGHGISGVRLARALRAESSSVRIYLLSDAPDDAQQVWACANGATAVMPRQARAIARCLSALEPPPGPAAAQRRAACLP